MHRILGESARLAPEMASPPAFWVKRCRPFSSLEEQAFAFNRSSFSNAFREPWLLYPAALPKWPGPLAL